MHLGVSARKLMEKKTQPTIAINRTVMDGYGIGF